MDELSPRARALLDRAQSEFSPSMDEADRLHARLFDAPPPDDPDDGDESTPSAGGDASPAGATGYFGLYLALAAVVIAWLVWPAPERDEPVAEATPVIEPSTTTIRPAPAPPPPALPPARVVAPAKPSPKPPAPRDDAVPPPDPPPSRADEAPVARTSRRARPAAVPAPIPDEPPPPEPPTDDLAAELALIGEARRALNGERWSALRELVAEHGRRFPKGVLRDEAEVLDLIARCRTEASDALPDALRETVRAYLDTPGRAFAKRLRHACLE